ncbi:hypothetical protein [Methylobacterium oryzae]|uniref:hypothetical protein n=1 Tax=Methylobacterium oryzae TaxID=334852 RepID=UPI002F35E833
MRVETRQPIQSAGGVASARKPEGGAAFSLGAAPSSPTSAGAPAAAATLRCKHPSPGGAHQFLARELGRRNA